MLDEYQCRQNSFFPSNKPFYLKLLTLFVNCFLSPILEYKF